MIAAIASEDVALIVSALEAHAVHGSPDAGPSRSCFYLSLILITAPTTPVANSDPTLSHTHTHTNTHHQTHTPTQPHICLLHHAHTQKTHKTHSKTQ